LRLRFLGTRGEIERRSALHRRHSSLLVAYRTRSVLIDFGLDWLGRTGTMAADAVLLTHAHPDHAAGLRDGCPWPVHATAATWRAMGSYPITKKEVVRHRSPQEIAGMTVEAFPVEHSLRAPAVGYRINAGNAAIFYAPDLVSIRGRRAALAEVDLYVGDGAAIPRSIVRRRDGVQIGHASMCGRGEGECARAGTGRARGGRARWDGGPSFRSQGGGKKLTSSIALLALWLS
jgi:hypothetical protein